MNLPSELWTQGFDCIICTC